jgi:hypothetical protein
MRQQGMRHFIGRIPSFAFLEERDIEYGEEKNKICLSRMRL